MSAFAVMIIGFVVLLVAVIWNHGITGLSPFWAGWFIMCLIAAFVAFVTEAE